MQNKVELFNDKWSFVKQNIESNLEVESYHEVPETFDKVRLPHDWLIEDSRNLYQSTIGWYKKNYHHNDINENVLLKFDGVHMESYLYVNGNNVGTWKNGYTSFVVDISRFLQEGDNQLMMKVVYQSPNSRWYTGAGIYRNIWKIEAGPVYFLDEDVYIHTKKIDEALWEIQVDMETNIDFGYRLEVALLDQNKLMASKQEDFSGKKQTSLNMQVKDVKTWSPADPYLYELEVHLLDEANAIVQKSIQKLGFKEVKLIPDKGMLLNGEKFKIQGVCEHHDLGALGATSNVEVLRQRFLLLKEMGVNAIRTAHNVPSPEFMLLADEMGFLILSEAFDIWRKAKTPYDYSRFFDEYAKDDVIRWIKRDRNHTSLFMWSIGNEIYDTHESEAGFETAQMLYNLVREIDYKQNAVASICSNYMPWPNTQKVADMIKIVGYNYGEKYFDEHHQMYPDWVIYGSETASLVQSRGVYHFPLEASVLADDDEQCSALGNSSTSWGAKSIESLIDHYENKEYALGQFIWTGFDYIGEPTPYHTKNSYFGQIDTAGFEKDSYYMYKAAWTNYEVNPFVHVFPYWDFNIGQTIDVRVASNAPFVELFLNGKSLGKQQSAFTKDGFVVPSWKVVYSPGTITAVGYDTDGKEIAKESQESFNDSKSISLKTNKSKLIADSNDTIFLDIICLDDKGKEVKNASNRMNITVTGDGTLIGLDNGDSTDFDQYKGSSKRLFNGKLRAFIQSTNLEGEIEVTVSSPGMADAQINILTIGDSTNDKMDGISKEAIVDVKNQELINEIPIRKINLAMLEGNNDLTPGSPSIHLEANLLPRNASYSDLEWRLVEKNGAPTSKAKFTQLNKTQINVTAIADGEFKVRCMSKNGSENFRIISELDVSATGFGVDYKNAFELISASKTDFQTDNITNGNEKGIATARGEESIVGYHFVNFGDTFVDRIELPIFALDDSSYNIEIYDGHPEKENTKLLVNGVYQKPSKWNTYQNETFKLNKHLTKVHQIYIRTYGKMHIKGLIFHPSIDVNREISITSSNFVYGDSYKQYPDRIEQIGNNVSIVFERLQLGETPTHSLRIKGSTPNKANTILLKFRNEDEILETSVDFQNSSDYTTQEFEIPQWKGSGEMTFVFLPGSNFNFKSIEFVTKERLTENEA